ncbi:MAG: hypothetical protein IJP56_04240 [Synergistaceae bacterium]|nr:hypothetical protein [Synergistaceae bacterium]
MPPVRKIIDAILSGTRDNNITFADLQRVLLSLGFKCRVIYWRSGIDEIINIQPDGNKAKAYQVKQVRDVIIKYRLI